MCSKSVGLCNCNMHYILVIESETTGCTTCKIQPYILDQLGSNMGRIITSGETQVNARLCFINGGNTLVLRVHEPAYKQGFPAIELKNLEMQLRSLNINMSTEENSIEVDAPGVNLLNLLANNNYRVSNQSMVIEKSKIGGRTTQVQKIVWTLKKE